MGPRHRGYYARSSRRSCKVVESTIGLKGLSSSKRPQLGAYLKEHSSRHSNIRPIFPPLLGASISGGSADMSTGIAKEVHTSPIRRRASTHLPAGTSPHPLEHMPTRKGRHEHITPITRHGHLSPIDEQVSVHLTESSGYGKLSTCGTSQR